MVVRRRAALVSIFALAACFPALPQTPGQVYRLPDASEEKLNSGDLLVASEKLRDPNFSESVVLVLDHDEDGGTLGLIVNRRSEIPIAKVFPDIKGATADRVYVGGPVSLTAVQALLRLPAQVEDVRHVAADLYATGSKQVIEKSVRSRVAASKFRLYVGYAGWAPGQLEAELQLGAWSVLTNRLRVVFDDNPETLWSRLTHESHMQIARIHFDLLSPYGADVSAFR